MFYVLRTSLWNINGTQKRKLAQKMKQSIYSSCYGKEEKWLSQLVKIIEKVVKIEIMIEEENYDTFA